MIKLKDLLIEAKGDASDCLLLPLNLEERLWDNILNDISKSDVWDKEEGFGLEEEPHVTILYGIQSNLIQKEAYQENIKYFFANCNPIIIESCGVSVFENDKYDVLKFDIVCNSELAYARRFAISLPHQTSFPDYIPHCTVAYLKKGSGKKYADELNKKYSFSTVADKVIYSECNGNRHQIQLGIS